MGEEYALKDNQDLRFGAVILQDFPYQELVKLWQKFDSLNFDTTWIADHFVNYAHPDSPWLDGWSALAG